MSKSASISRTRNERQQSAKMERLNVFADVKLKRERRLSVEIYEVLRSLIITTTLKPGQSINEVDVGESLGVSRTPVREAFLSLARDGFIKMFPQSRIEVSIIDAKELEHAMFIRETLELALIPLVIEKLDDTLVSKLESINRKIKDAVTDNDYIRFIENDDLFHRTISESVGNELVLDTMRQMSGRLDRLRYITSAMPGAAEVSVKDHDNLIKALKDKDAAKTEKILKAHLQRSWSKLSKAIEMYVQ